MTGHITAFSPLIEIAEEDQIEEVESYLRDKGATFPEATTAPSTLDRLLRIVDVSHVIFEDAKLPQNEVEGFFFSVVSFFHLLELEQKQPVVDKMCTKVMAGATTENGPFKLRILGLMFCHLKPTDPLCYLIFCHRLRLAKQLRLTSTALTMDLDKLKRWVDGWSLSQSDKRALYKLLWEAYEHVNLQLATKFLVELLKTYSASSAQEEEEPQRLVEHAIVLAIADGRQLVFDDLLTLPVVKAVQSKKIYQLFDIFVRERLSAFEKFYKENKSFVDDLGLKYDECVRKMRLLTLASLAEECRDIPFATLTAELNLPAEELEMFVVEAIGMRLIEARVNQVMQRVVITKSVYRTLTTDHWKLLHKRLSVWKQNIHAVKSSLNNFKSVQ
ncbi:hypothetical protein EMCRGX_G009489 [Ephydatia muelleri]